MEAENRGQLVRGVCIVGFNRSGLLSIECAKDEENLDCIVAYTPWHRHDEDLSIVKRELDQIISLYMSMGKTSGCACLYEYQGYKK